jgi:hypothetical protein
VDVSLILGNFLTPPILLFFLGMAATLLKSDLDIPQAVTRGLSVYLLFAIGMHGGVELARSGFQLSTLLPLGAGVLAGALMPVLAFVVLRRRVRVEDAAERGIGPLLREAMLNGPVFLLFGSLLVGLVTGERGWEAVKPFAYDPFRGVLCLFLLDMGLIAARRLDALRASGAFLGAFAVVVPLLAATGAIGAAAAMRLTVGDALHLRCCARAPATLPCPPRCGSPCQRRTRASTCRCPSRSPFRSTSRSRSRFITP